MANAFIEKLAEAHYECAITDTGMVSRDVARGPYNEQSEMRKEYHHRFVRAVLLAAREPTDEMTEAGWEFTGDPCWQKDVALCWQTMIDRALHD